jgi:hypothetical protein
MIYSQDHNFLLIKNEKVGGTSLEVELSKVLPENAIVTPIIPPNLNHTPRNHKDIFYNHMGYSEIKQFLNLENVKSYVMVRNPYDSVLSYFFHLLQRKILNISTYNIKENTDLTKKIDVYFKKYLFHGTHKLYTENNKIVVDKILYYENGVESEINKVLSDHNIKQIKMTTFEKKDRPEWATYKKMFNREQIDIINSAWAWEFENLEYDRL